MIIETTDPSDLAQESGETGDEAAMALLMSRADQAEQQEEEEPEQQEAAGEGEEAQEAEESAETEEVEDDDPEFDLGDVKAKKSEILAWKAGEMKDADYRRKTAEAAEAKRAAQAQLDAVRQEREQRANQLDAYLHLAHQQLIGDQQHLAKLALEDPAAWVAEKQAMEQRHANFQALLQERQELANRQRAEQDRAVQEWRKEERERLLEKLPDWRDSTKASADQKLIAEYLLEQGYTREELSDLYEHRSLIVARDAAKWRQHQAAQKSVKDKQVKPEPAKAIKPGVANQKTQDDKAVRVEELRKRAQRTGKQDDIAAYLVAKSG